jgi:hypothetical protein
VQVFWLDDVITLNRLHGHVVEALAAASACSAFDTMELAGADDKDGKPDSGELSGESESNAATIFYRTNEPWPISGKTLHHKPRLTRRSFSEGGYDVCRRAELARVNLDTRNHHASHEHFKT